MTPPPPPTSSSSSTSPSSSIILPAAVTSTGSPKSCPRNRSSSLTTIPSASSASSSTVIAIPFLGNGQLISKQMGKQSSSRSQQVTPSSSPEPGTSPRALAVAGWQSLVDEHSELRTGLVTGEEGIRLIEDEGDDEEEEADDSDQEEVAANVFAITDSQHEYYCKQFHTVQPDVSGVVSGSTVKSFFEKSALSAQDLAHIWHLCDYDQAGCLNRNKWCVAMHLTVLRRNGVDLPDLLPAELFAAAVHGHARQKSARRHTTATSSHINIINHSDPQGTRHRPQQQQQLQQDQHHLIPSLASSSSSSCDPELHLSHQHQHQNHNNNNSHSWTKFSDSPTNSTTDLHSLNFYQNSHHSLPLQPQVQHQPPLIPPKQQSKLFPQQQQQQGQHSSQTPANFDFSASSIELDPAILHPIPLRLTPEAQVLFTSLTDFPTTTTTAATTGTNNNSSKR